MAFVVKRSECKKESNESGSYFHIVNRGGGLISRPLRSAYSLVILFLALILPACGSSGGGDDSASGTPPVSQNQEPSSVISADDAYDEDSMFSVDGSSSGDSDGTVTTYLWSVEPIDGVELALSGGDQAMAEIQVGEIADDISLTVTLAVTDNAGAISNSTKTILIREIHRDMLPPNPGSSSLTPLAGIDVDADGVRDDVEHGIYELYPLDKEMRTVMNFGARSLQMAMISGASGNGVDSAAVEVSTWASCMVAVQLRDDLEIDYATREMSKVDVLTFNTAERVAAKLSFESALDGTIFESNAVDMSDCDNT